MYANTKWITPGSGNLPYASLAVHQARLATKAASVDGGTMRQIRGRADDLTHGAHTRAGPCE